MSSECVGTKLPVSAKAQLPTSLPRCMCVVCICMYSGSGKDPEGHPKHVGIGREGPFWLPEHYN